MSIAGQIAGGQAVAAPSCFLVGLHAVLSFSFLLPVNAQMPEYRESDQPGSYYLGILAAKDVYEHTMWFDKG